MQITFKTYCERPLVTVCWSLLFALLPGSLAVGADEAKSPEEAKPALTVTVARPKESSIARKLSANGNVFPWQEAVIGTEVNGLRLKEVLVNVGDKVKRGQVLATFAAETVAADLAQLKANVAESEANLAEAVANADRAKSVASTGALSAQQMSQYLAAEKTAKARLLAQRAALEAQQVRLNYTRVLAPDSGVISARTATLGAVSPVGQELFRLIRQERLEWRAEVNANQLSALNVGAAVHLFTANNQSVLGKIRMLAPTVNAQTRLGLVYVDLPLHADIKAGMYLKGEFDLGSSAAMTVTQQAVVVRDGFSYMFIVDDQQRVQQLKVSVGRRSGEQIEITAGLPANARFVVKGAGFLNDGDLVKVVDSEAKPITADPAGQANKVGS